MKRIIRIDDTQTKHGETVGQIAEKGIPAEAREIYRARNVVARLMTPAGEINVKSFHCPSLINGYVYTTLRRSKARRSFDYARRLLAMGFRTPKPIAYVEVRDGHRLRESYYISEQIEAEDMRQPELRSDERELLEALGIEMARLHKAGVFMLDFSPGNVLFTKDSEGRYAFSYVDLNRTQFDVRDPRRLMDMFKSLVFQPRQAEILARAYARAAGVDEEATVAEALLRQARFGRHWNRKRKIKKMLMPWKKKYRS